MSGTTELELEKIRTDGGTQVRAKLREEAIEEYAEKMKAGAQFPPVVVFHDGESYWLADGFHRVAAWKKAGTTMVPCDVRQGTVRDAVLFSVGANDDHGVQRTNADKRRAVETLLRDDEWSQWSDHEIARRALVSQPFVSKVRSSKPSDNRYQIGAPKRETRDAAKVPITRKVSRKGTTYRQSVGTRSKQKPASKAKPAAQEEPTPAKEASAIEDVRKRARSAMLTWRQLVDEWEAKRRFDMAFATKSSKAIVAAFQEVERLLDEVLAQCVTT